MSFSTVLSTIDQYVKLKQWLQLVGLMLVFGGLAFITDYPHAAKLTAYVGASVSTVGFAYDLVYP